MVTSSFIAFLNLTLFIVSNHIWKDIMIIRISLVYHQLTWSHHSLLFVQYVCWNAWRPVYYIIIYTFIDMCAVFEEVTILIKVIFTVALRTWQYWWEFYLPPDVNHYSLSPWTETENILSCNQIEVSQANILLIYRKQQSS